MAIVLGLAGVYIVLSVVLWALQEKITSRTALKRPGSAEDVAQACLFFATGAPYVTGQILAVDGGRSIGW